MRLAVHVAGDPESFAPRLRALAGAVDPAAMVSDPVPLDDVVACTAPTLRALRIAPSEALREGG